LLAMWELCLRIIPLGWAAPRLVVVDELSLATTTAEGMCKGGGSQTC